MSAGANANVTMDALPPAAASASSPNDRATTFQAVQGESEHYNGATLLVTAYAALWVIVLAWVALSWRRQSGLQARLSELEEVIAKADSGGPGEGPGQPKR